MQKLTEIFLFIFLVSLGFAADAPMVKICLSSPDHTSTPSQLMKKIIKTDEEWRTQLGEATYAIARGKGTERPFCGGLLDNKEAGIYECICCGLPLFRSDTKFLSGTGWPSFFAPFAQENITSVPDHSHGMSRVEILCTRCDAHLGHVFSDGPPPTGQRYCVNSASLKFVPNKSEE